MPLEDDPTVETSAAVEPSPLATADGGAAADFPLPCAPPLDEDSFPFPFPMLLLLLLLLLLLKTCVTLSMTLPLMMIPILEAALRGDEEAAEAAEAEWAAEAGGAAALGGARPPAASAATAASLFPFSLSASAAAAADSGEGRELGCLGGCGGGAAGVAGLLRLNPSEVILREISFEARSTTPGVLAVAVAVALLAIGAVLLLPPLDEVVVAPAGLPLFIVLSGRRVNRVNPPSAAAADERQFHRDRV